MQSFKKFFYEMAQPNKGIASKTYYHGTHHKKAVDGMIKEGLAPSVSTSNIGLTPKQGMAYITPSLEYAAIYSGNHPTTGGTEDDGIGWIVEIDGADLKDVYPDEDVLGEYAVKGVKDSKYRWVTDILELRGGNDNWIETEEPDDPEDEYYEGDMEHYEEYSNMTLFDAVSDANVNAYLETWAQVGKHLMDVMTPEELIKFIDQVDPHIAHRGHVPIRKAYRVSGKFEEGNYTPEELDRISEVYYNK